MTERFKKMSTDQMLGFLGTFALAADLALSVACSGGGSINYCNATACGTQTTQTDCIIQPTVQCVCTSGTPDPTHTQCPSNIPPGTNPTLSAIAGAAQAIGAGNGMVSSEQHLASTAKVVNSAGGPGFAQTGAATAGGLASGSSAAPSGATGAGSAGNSASTPTQSSSGFGGTGQTASGMAVADLKTAAADNGVVAPSGTGDSTNVGGTYGNAGAVSANHAGANGYDKGPGISGEADGAASTDVSFGANSDAAGSVIAVGDDPLDYFTRIGLGDSLFKIVEKRYRTKAVGWASVGVLQKPADSALTLNGQATPKK